MLEGEGMPSAGDTIGYRFRLIRELGHGSMGTVWLAWHLTLEVPCAVKFIVSEGASDAAYRTRFDTEARATARLRSPNVVRVLDHSLSGDEDPYIAMELLDGEDLRARLAREGRLSPHATCDLVSQVARGLAEAHAAGIVHRDLKPENIFFAREREQEVVKILDFGVARWNARSPVDEGDGLIGTLEYMSPEVARGAAVDPRSDLWALGVIAYECLTGCVPFTGESIQEVLGSIKGGVARVPSELAPELGPDFDRWWTHATSPAIEDRFDGAEELARSLEQTLGLGEAAGKEGELLRADRPEDPASLAPVEGGASSADGRRPPPRVRAMRVIAAGLLGGAVAALVLSAPVNGERFDASFVRSTLAFQGPSSVAHLLLRARAALPRVTFEPAATGSDSTGAATLAAAEPSSVPRPPEPAPIATPSPAVAPAFHVATPVPLQVRPGRAVRFKPAAPMTRDAGPDDVLDLGI